MACARRCRVTPEAYAHMTAMLGAVAPLAVLLEGGYNLTATAAGCEAVLRVLLGAKPPRFAKPAVPCTAALMALQQVVAVQVRAHVRSSCPAHPCSRSLLDITNDSPADIAPASLAEQRALVHNSSEGAPGAMKIAVHLLGHQMVFICAGL